MIVHPRTSAQLWLLGLAAGFGLLALCCDPARGEEVARFPVTNPTTVVVERSLDGTVRVVFEFPPADGDGDGDASDGPGDHAPLPPTFPERPTTNPNPADPWPGVVASLVGDLGPRERLRLIVALTNGIDVAEVSAADLATPQAVASVAMTAALNWLAETATNDDVLRASRLHDAILKYSGGTPEGALSAAKTLRAYLLHVDPQDPMTTASPQQD